MPMAALTSTEVTVACAIVDRAKARWSVPGSARSSTYLPSPVSKVGSSRRRTAFPRMEPAVAIGDDPPRTAGRSVDTPQGPARPTRGSTRTGPPWQRAGMAEHDPVIDLHARAETVRRDLGGADKVQRLHAEGQRTVREHIAGLLDAGSFSEIGTFSRSLRPEDRDRTPGDGKIGGHGTVDGRPVVVFGDDITVLRGSSSIVGTRKEERLYERALAMGVPIVHFGQTGGARIPDTMGAEGISEPGGLFPLAARHHRVPMATAIVGQSFGGSSFLSALSDFVVMTRGSCLAVTSPRVFEVATGEIITFEEVGGVEVHARHTGQIDLAVEDDDEAYAAIRRWLSYLPSNAREPAPRTARAGAMGPDPGLAELVPARRTRGYDMRRVVSCLCDEGSVF